MGQNFSAKKVFFYMLDLIDLITPLLGSQGCAPEGCEGRSQALLVIQNLYICCLFYIQEPGKMSIEHASIGSSFIIFDEISHQGLKALKNFESKQQYRVKRRNCPCVQGPKSGHTMQLETMKCGKWQRCNCGFGGF